MSLFTRIIKFHKKLSIPLDKLSQGMNKRGPHLVCLANRDMLFHTSAYKFKRRKVGDEKKAIRILEYPKVKGDFVDVWKNMTAGELAQALGKNLNYVKDLCTNLMKIEGVHTEITDMKILQQAIRRSGRRMLVIANPAETQLKSLIDKDVYPRPPAPKSVLKSRPPVVTVMGHVDHGKTTLLDALRHSRVVDQEFGGITQHIGAFSVVLDSGAKITFLDTPGHAAFTAMRERGALATDIVVLVVAADDGVMEQTIESIRMAREANVPILVAINKIDSPKADVERAQDMLIQVGLQVEQRGGDIQAIPISALKKQNLNQLVEALVVQAELLEICADPTGFVEGVVIESKLDPNRGKLGTIIVQRGTLKKGDVLVVGPSMGKVRAMRDSQGNILKEVTPGNPAEIEGWKDLPSPGELILQVASERRAREVIKVRQDKIAEARIAEDMIIIKEKQAHHEKQYRERLELKRSLGRYRLRNQGPRQPETSKEVDPNPSLNLVIKSDVDGTLEAVLNTLDTYDSTDCKMDLVHYGVGAITENDIELATTFKALVYAFNIGCPPQIQELAKTLGVTIKYHNVIYKLVDDVKEEINQRLPQKEVEEIIGEATVLQQFEINIGRKKVLVAGCRCIKGTLRKSANYKLLRKNEVIHVGHLSSMKHLKDDTDVIKTNMECGLQLFDKTITFEQGDTLLCFQTKLVDQVTTWDPGF